MEESNKFVAILISILISVILISTIITVVSIGKNQQDKMIAQLGELNVQYDITPLDGRLISGSAIHALIARGVPVKADSYGPNLTREEARMAYESTSWYKVSVLSGNEDVILVT